jgi:polyphosphate kinase 2 (PPK2 family)
MLYESEDENWKELDFIHEYNEYLPIIGKVLEKIDMPYAPWTIVGASDKNFVTIKIITTAIQAIETYIERITRTHEQQTIKYLDRAISKLPELSASVLDKVDFSPAISTKEYKKLKKLYQQKLETLQYELFRKKRSIVIIFEGWDATGKGGDIHRLVQGLNPIIYRWYPWVHRMIVKKLIITSGASVKEFLKQGT